MLPVAVVVIAKVRDQRTAPLVSSLMTRKVCVSPLVEFWTVR